MLLEMCVLGAGELGKSPLKRRRNAAINDGVLKDRHVLVELFVKRAFLMQGSWERVR